MKNEVISSRIKEGMKMAKLEGRVAGRPSKDNKAIEEAIKLYYKEKYTIKEIVKMAKIGKTTLYRYIQKLTYSEVDALRRQK